MNTRTLSSTIGLGLAATLLVSSGCSQSVVVKTERPAQVVLAGQDLGTVGPEGVEASVQHGFGPVPYELVVDGERVEGRLERTDLSLWPATAACGLAALSVPVFAVCAAAAVNPGLTLALALSPIPVLLAGTVQTLAVAVWSASWATPLASCAGATVGLSPLSLLGMSDLPESVTLPTPAAPTVPPGALAQATPSGDASDLVRSARGAYTPTAQEY